MGVVNSQTHITTGGRYNTVIKISGKEKQRLCLRHTCICPPRWRDFELPSIGGTELQQEVLEIACILTPHVLLRQMGSVFRRMYGAQKGHNENGVIWLSRPW